MSYYDGRAEAASRMAAGISTTSAAARKIAYLEARKRSGRNQLSIAVMQRRRKGSRVQSQAEVKIHERLLDIDYQIRAVRERLRELQCLFMAGPGTGRSTFTAPRMAAIRWPMFILSRHHGVRCTGL
jgi:hypothetical protein